jgi:oligoendopeptidase F
MSADWNLDDYFDDGHAPFADALERDLAAFEARLASAPVDRDLLDAFEALDNRTSHLAGYLGCRSAADARDEEIQRALGRRARLGAFIDRCRVALASRLRALPDDDFAALEGELGDAAHYVRRLRDKPATDDARETLAANLHVDGLDAWARLYNTVSGNLSFELDGETVPVSMTRTLLEDPDPQKRRRAFKAANGSWATAAPSLAAALNAIAGWRLTLARERGAHYLDPACFQSAISRDTLEAMLGTVKDRRPLAQGILKDKAARLGLDRLDYCDLLAPAPQQDEARLTFDEGKARVLDAFSTYPDLHAFAAEAIDRAWIDHTPRPGKRPGAFCSTSRLIRQSRVFMTFHGSLGDVRTLAHELGHAFHGRVMKDLRPWATSYPMTLAETASTFAEQLLTGAVLDSDDASDDEKRGVLDRRLTNACAFLLNTPMRFHFEDALYARRQDGELSVSDLNTLMLETQREVYGDSLDELDPLFWASKLHFFLSGVSFYNFPYTFGFLFSLGIYSRYRAEGDAFLPRYEAILKDTGRKDAETVARDHLGVDLTKPDFWSESIDLVAEDLAALRGLS